MNKAQWAYEQGFKTGLASIKKNSNGLVKEYNTVALACSDLWDAVSALSSNDGFGIGSDFVKSVETDDMKHDQDIQKAYDRIQDLYSELKGAIASMSELADGKAKDPRTIEIPTSGDLAGFDE